MYVDLIKKLGIYYAKEKLPNIALAKDRPGNSRQCTYNLMKVIIMTIVHHNGQMS